MSMLNWIRLILGIAFLVIGMITFAVEIIGVFYFKFVLNRMHTAAMGDTLGIGASLLCVILLWGFSITSAKFALVLAFLWCSSPVSSHLISRLEAVTDPDLSEACSLSDEVKEKIGELQNRDEEK